ncbi:flagellar motor switch protein FliM [Desulfarculus baarsii DSM 2075]|uniref:Flagellar motor switch protein FliM n=1 Tax=Desulfarculus baarsii (strain ATCC 33931 / DSM 2075 / LMG 7858 / VKM B-1802 / 2st14) TaxID=644282 RepID=E1QJD1_DESB2|nr:flagellar motor switch protein FliM [Desulfarculus baarsii]ADK85674.1 flagellar motor switch protein FliM [Desulfarculus baarsii DSM 2075]
MSKILTQDEVDALLKGMSGGEIEVETDAGPEADGVIVYDLTNQDRIIRGRMPTLEIINDRFARLFRTTLSSALRKIVDMTTTSVDMVKFGEFMRSLPVPTSLHIFKMDPLRGHAIFVLESKLVFNLVETFFGGAGGGNVKIEGRDFTAIEQQLTRKVVMLALKDMESAWKPVHEVTMVYSRTEINPQFASIVPPTDVVIVVKFELEMEHTAGTVTVCIPYSTIEPIRTKLYAGFQSDQLEVDHEWMRRFRKQLREAEVEFTVELGRTELTSGDLLQLKVGDVLQLDSDINGHLVAMVEGVPKFLGRPGQMRGNKAFRVEGFKDYGAEI